MVWRNRRARACASRIYTSPSNLGCWLAARSKSITEFLDRPFEVVVTVCDDAREACPVFPGGERRVHRAFPDPAIVTGTEAERLEAFRRVRDEVRAWAEEFVGAL